jgi:hypothetical protein
MVLLTLIENFKGRMFKKNEIGSVLSSFLFLASKSFSNPKTFSLLCKKVKFSGSSGLNHTSFGEFQIRWGSRLK